jgi:hypothetical protein
MRRFVAPAFALLTVVAFAVPFVVSGCASSPSEGQTHGPVFEFDGAVPVTPDGGESDDATTPVGTNEASAGDAPSPLGDATVDGAGHEGGASDDAGEPFGADCGSPTVVVAGSGSSLVGALAVGTGAFTTQTLTGSLAVAPAIVASSGGFQAMLAMNVDAGGGDALFGVGLAGTTWSSPAALGESAGTIDGPAIAAMGSTVQGVYLNPNHLYFHAQFDGTSWDTGTDKVEVGAAPQSFGPVRASVAATAAELVMAYEGNDAHLYAQSWTSGGGWQSAVEVGTLKLGTNIAPAIIALSAPESDGGTSDFLVVYAVASTATPPLNYINYALRDAASKTWSSPALTNITAYTPYEPSLAAMSGGRAIVGWRGGNNLPYTMEFDPAPTPTWTVPTPIASVTIDAAPSLATGTCGYDAVAALATNGAVTVANYTSDAWIPPTPIAGISGAAYAAIATSP